MNLGEGEDNDPLRFLPAATSSEYHVLGLSSDDDDDETTNQSQQLRSSNEDAPISRAAPEPPLRRSVDEGKTRSGLSSEQQRIPSASPPTTVAASTPTMPELFGKQPQMTIRVSFAGLVIHGLTQDLSFIVETEGLTARCFSVRRLAEDFTSLRDMLKSRYPGMIVPPLVQQSALFQGIHGAPQATEREIQKRLASLQNFLTLLSQHPRLSLSPEVASFLQLKAFRTVASDPSVQLGEQLGKLAGSFRREVLNVMDSVTPERASDIDDPQFARMLQIRELAEQFDHRLSSVARAFSELADRSRQSTATFNSLKSLLATLADGETNLQDFYLHLASVCGGISSLHERAATSEDLEFVQPMQEFIQLTGNLVDVIKHNMQVLSKFHVVQRTLHQVQLQHEQLLAEKRQPAQQRAQWIFSFSDDIDTRLEKSAIRVDDLLDQLKTWQASVSDLANYFMDEMKIFNVWKVLGFQRLFTLYIDRKIEFHQQAVSAWNSLRNDVRSIDTSLASLSVGWWPQEYPVAAHLPSSSSSSSSSSSPVSRPVSALFSPFSTPSPQPPSAQRSSPFPLGEPVIGDQPGFAYPTLLTES